MAVESFTTAGSGSWNSPSNIQPIITVEVWGAGGGGGGQNLSSDGGGGGGGGAYCISTLTITPGNSYTYYVGTGGTGGTGVPGTTGEDTWFSGSAVIRAKGGVSGSNSTGTPPAGGAGGSATLSIGTTKFNGGQGGRGRDSTTGRGAPGGSSAGTDGNGTSGPDPWSTATAATPTATDAGIGGNGGNANNQAGFAPASGQGGGGGGAAEGTNIRGGDGANGWVRITYTLLGGATFIRWIDDQEY